jgi:hypothetical protein
VSAYLCTCGYDAASDGELGDHWGEAFIPPDDRDAAGVRHAEVTSDEAVSEPGTSRIAGLDADHTTSASRATTEDAGGARPRRAAFACLCGDAFDHLGKLDDHLLTAFIPADRIGFDGRIHAPGA